MTGTAQPDDNFAVRDFEEYRPADRIGGPLVTVRLASGPAPEQYLEQYLSRDVSILLGAEDDDPAALLLEVSPAAMAQGSNRLERGIRHHEHIREMARRRARRRATG